MALVTTMDPILWPLMDGRTINTDHCVVCGALGPLNQHHVVYKSQGQLIENGLPRRKPTITLCGHGNVLSLNGRPCCHGMAHQHLLHFRWNDERWEFLRTMEPTKYADALGMPGWAPIRYA